MVTTGFYRKIRCHILRNDWEGEAVGKGAVSGETRVKVQIPATMANLGPGFDCLGLALGLYNEVTLEVVPEGLTIDIGGEGSGTLSAGKDNLVVAAAETVFSRAGYSPPGLRIRLQNNIPVGSGLGSSAAATLGGMVAANALVAGGLAPEELLEMAAGMEHHADNVVPAFHGGLTLVNRSRNGLDIECIDVPLMWVVVVMPDFDLPTSAARAALPATVPLSDAIFNASRLALLVRALEAGDYSRLGLAMQDELHQKFRVPLIPGMREAFSAAERAGAAAAVLSGAGPSVAAFAPDGHERIAKAMQAAFEQKGLDSRSWILPTDSHGCRVLTG
jgi:homoserine kinase